MTAVAMLSGVAVVAGVILVATGIRERPVPVRPPRRWFRPESLPSPERAAMAGAAALVVLVITRWPVAAAGAAIAVLLLSSPSRRQGSHEAEMADALTTWVEMLRDATGTPRGIEGVLVATADTAPEIVRPHVTALARRLPYEPLDDALGSLADDLDHPVGDLVVTALRLAARSGGRQIRGVLDDLATMAREDARMHRRIQVARARPRADMRAVLVLMGGFVAIFSFAARDYLSPYSTAQGQLVLLMVGACWATAIWAMARLGRHTPVTRFLARPVLDDAEDTDVAAARAREARS